MTRPTARVLALLELLQAGGTHTVGELAAQLGVDERTVRRYVTHLTDLDIPVHSVRGRYGGYRLAPGYRMPPLMLTDDEAVAVLLGLLTGHSTTSPHAAASATAKLRRVLPTRLGARLDALMTTAEFTTGTDPEIPAETAVLLGIAEAIHEHRSVAIGYTDRNGQPTRRTVHPYGLVAHSGRWYLTALDITSDALRRFRLDRIADTTTLPETFTPPVEFDPTTDLLIALATAPYRHDVSIRVQGTLAQVRPHLPETIAILHEIDSPPTDPTPWIRVLIRAEHLDWIPPVLATLDRPFVIEHPDALTDAVRALGQRLTAATTPDQNPTVR
ncbi:helix-turn-helix transcriptional regulator [Nocardia alba]|uniref:Putative DNA-binding transcriptional regulator YafY n=1 Tax=Nocardia alba TaxID=225051 RepID=A0A4R1FR04_9NOCA|nr:YafY family protein [Nocardia alba]TCJ97337.1 putative DNA-binding transcriptional regulator YafY [Nocardia alba]